MLRTVRGHSAGLLQRGTSCCALPLITSAGGPHGPLRTHKTVSPRALSRQGRLSPELLRLRMEDFSEDKPVEDGETQVLFGVAPCLLALRAGRRTLHQLYLKEDRGPRRVAEEDRGHRRVTEEDRGPRRVAEEDRGHRRVAEEDRGHRRVTEEDRGPRRVTEEDRGPRRVTEEDRGPRRVAEEDRGHRRVTEEDRGPRRVTEEDRGPRRVTEEDRGHRRVTEEDRGPRRVTEEDRGHRRVTEEDRGPRRVTEEDRGHRRVAEEDRVPGRVAVQRVLQEARMRGVPVQRCSRRQLDGMSEQRVHQGVCLRASALHFQPLPHPQPVPVGAPPPLWLVLEHVQDPMNLGAILRSAYYLGVDRVVSSVRNSCPLTPVVSKASSGAMELMDVYGCEDLVSMLQAKVEQDWQVVGTVGMGDASVHTPVLSCSEYRQTRPTLLLMGGESSGLSVELQRLCGTLLSIFPRRELDPYVESLNVSVAAGILLHTLLSGPTCSSR